MKRLEWVLAYCRSCSHHSRKAYAILSDSLRGKSFIKSVDCFVFRKRKTSRSVERVKVTRLVAQQCMAMHFSFFGESIQPIEFRYMAMTPFLVW